MDTLEVDAIRHFFSWQKLIEPHFNEIDRLMSTYYKSLPSGEAFRVANTLQRVVKAFQRQDGTELNDGDSRIVVAYYYKCSRAYRKETRKAIGA